MVLSAIWFDFQILIQFSPSTMTTDRHRPHWLLWTDGRSWQIIIWLHRMDLIKIEISLLHWQLHIMYVDVILRLPIFLFGICFVYQLWSWQVWSGRLFDNRPPTFQCVWMARHSNHVRSPEQYSGNFTLIIDCVHFIHWQWQWCFMNVDLTWSVWNQ